MDLSAKLPDNLATLNNIMGIDANFDILVREFKVAGCDAALVMVDGFIKDQVTQRIIQSLQSLKKEEILPNKIDKLLEVGIGYFETSVVTTIDEVVEQALAGPAVLLIDGEDKAIVLDVREYPVRSIEEPNLERVTRGARDGFVETIIFNTALLRRRLRDPRLRVEATTAGRRSRTDIAIVYIQDITNPKLVEQIKQRIAAVDTDGLAMGAKTLEEYLIGMTWNPLPRIRYTERPDVAAAHLLEGHVCIFVDTTPMAIILPTSAWHFTQHAEEFFQNPTVGTYLRFIRFWGILVSLVLTPLWLALVTDKQILPEFLRFLGPKEPSQIPLLAQFILLELSLDLIRMAFIHTPDALATSLGLVGAILLGQFAVEVGLFAAEPILYTAIVAIGMFATPSVEFALAARLFRLGILILAGIFGLVGLAAGLVTTFLVFAFTKSFDLPYLWPLVPFDLQALLRLLVRSPVPAIRRRPPFANPENRDRTPNPGSKE